MSRLIAAAAVAALALAGCGGGDDDNSSGDSNAAAGAAASTDTGVVATKPAPGGAPGTTIKTSSSDYGTILFDGDDRAIYLFAKETSEKSECYGDCADAWPPVLTKGAPSAGTGADAGLLGTTERDDGTTQVTYKGHPLYYYEGDARGQVGCQNVSEFGGLWLVLKPSGEAVQGA
jgi:predicted lipoprotein with Yx(FWY)xxD motif